MKNELTYNTNDLRRIKEENDVKSLIKLYDDNIGGEESEIYKKCKCPSSVNIMMQELVIKLIKNES